MWLEQRQMFDMRAFGEVSRKEEKTMIGVFFIWGYLAPTRGSWAAGEDVDVKQNREHVVKPDVWSGGDLWRSLLKP